MKEKRKIITLPCDCKCCMFVIEKTVWEDGDINYDISQFGDESNGRQKSFSASQSITVMFTLKEQKPFRNWLTIWAGSQNQILTRRRNNESRYLCPLFF